MRVTVYPKRLLLTAVLILALSAVLSTATYIGQGGALGVAGLLAYLVFEVFFSVNPAAWRRRP
jgi:hypothetical protein